MKIKIFKSWSKCRPFSGLCSFILFTVLCVSIAVIIIYLVLQKKTNRICQFNFKKTAQRSIGYDSRPRHVDVADVNNDTYLDIIVANSGIDCIGIFIGNGLGTFQDQLTYSTGERSSPFSVAHGHFNDDLLVDIVVANYGINNIGVLLGNGDGTFRSPMMTSMGASRPLALAIEDFNKDNHSDLAVANYGTFTINVLFGLNNGSFRIGLSLQMEYDSIPYSLIITDFNKDNKLDIIVVNYGTSNLAILLSNDNESFVSQRYSTGKDSHPSSVIIGDFNNDRILDIVTSNSAIGNIGIFLGYGNGSVRDMIILSTGKDSRPHSIITNDLTNDGILDLVVIDRINNVILVLKGDGYGNFSMITNHSTGYHSQPTSIAFGYVDNDKIVDVVITNNATNNILLLTKYQSYPTIKPMTYSMTNDSNTFIYFVEVADLNNDNWSDVVLISKEESSVHIYLNLGNGTFRDERLSFISGPDVIAINDVNNDKQLDLIILISVDYEIRILLGYGNGSFDNDHSFIIKQEFYLQSIAVADLNNDHFLDIVIIFSPDAIHVLYGYGNGSFKDNIINSTAVNSQPTFVFVGDFNNDHIIDIVTSVFNNGRIDVLIGSVNESYTLSWRIATDDIFNSLTVGDLNNDHYLDIVYASASSSHVGIVFGYGNGRFTNITRYYTAPGSYSRSVVLGHMNNDTFIDIVVANYRDESITIFFGLGNGSFLPQTRFPTIFNSDPSEIRLGDFNNDKQLDIIVIDARSNNFSIYIMYYEMDFRNETSYFTGSGPHPSSVAIGYFNGDNQPDIVVANSGNDNIQLLLNYDKGMFMKKLTYSTGLGTEPQFVIVADFNRDNHSDIAVANYRNGTINVFLGYNNETLGIPSSVHQIGSDTFPSSITVGDFNEDNWTDLVVANYGTNSISIFLAFNYATFTNETIGNPGKSAVPVGITVGDFNNDHRWDIVVANWETKSIDVYLGYGNGSFAPPISFSTGFAPTSIVVGDFNDDKQLDIVVADGFGRSLNTWIGFGNGSFQNEKLESMISSYALNLLAVDDLNHDGRLDVVVTYLISSGIGVCMGQGDGSFTDEIISYLPYHSYVEWMVVDDLNNDHFSDVVITNSDPNFISVLFGYGNGSFGNMITLFTGENSGPASIDAADVNNDSWIDIVVANRNGKNVGIFFGDGNSTFSSQITYSTGTESNLYQIVVGDLNSDGKVDIAVADSGNGNNNVGVLYGHGDGHFTRIKSYSTGLNSDPRWLALCDFDNDSRLDMAIIYFNKDNIGIMLQRQTEPFATPLMYSTGNDSHPNSVVTGDFNHDHHLDIAVANSGTNSIGLFLGYGNGTFAAKQTFSTGNNSQVVSLAVGQLNNDTHLDIVVANPGINTISIFHGNGNGSLTLFTNYSTGISSIPSSIAVKDLNKDNYFDIVVTTIGSNGLIVFLGSNNGGFFESKSYSFGYQARPQSVTIEDMNNDNLYDIIVANYGTDYVEILLQTC